MYDAIVISDLHLGAYNCQTKAILEFLNKIETHKLIIAGDLFESFNSRLRKEEWNILDKLRTLSNDIPVIWVKGNHDAHHESVTISHIIGTEFYPIRYIFKSGTSKIVVIHGDMFDDFLTDHPILTYISDWIYWFLQKIDSSHTFAKIAKYSSKKYLHCSEIVHQESIKYANKFKCDIAIAGHTHFALEKDNYYNSGCWTENPCSYLTVIDGRIKLEYFNCAHC